MKTLTRFATSSTIFLIGVILSGCTFTDQGPSYEKAVATTERMLEARVDKGIFPFTKETQGEVTTFQFIEGSRWAKVDHVTPLRVTIAITRQDGGNSQFKVEAYEHGLILKRRDRDAGKRWRQELKRVIGQN
ncbi:hypothetical protein V2O64_21465 [Verrucomicrobiaceae bacterium 227]